MARTRVTAMLLAGSATLGVAVALPSTGFAQSTSRQDAASTEALQARIEALEAENRTLRRKLERSAPARVAAPAPVVDPPGSATPVVAQQAPPPTLDYASANRSIWSGAYAGFSLGAGALGGGKAPSTSTFNDTFTDPGSIEVDSGQETLSGNGRPSIGGIADVYVGYSHQMDRWVGAVQLEGSLGRLFTRFNRSGAFSSTDVTTTLVGGVPQPGPAISTTSGTDSQTNSLNITFMVSALARFGYLVGPRDQIYGLAGWTYAGFNTTLPNTDDPSFGAHGVTVGLGWEHQIADQWTLRAEYRYTKFQTVRLNSFFTVAEAGELETTQTNGSVSPDLHVVRVGLTRYFDDTLAVTGAFMPYKAPPTYASSWSGPYIGLSVGVGGMTTRAPTNNVLTDNFIEDFGGGLTSVGLNTETTTIDGKRQFGVGGVADLFVGYNRQMGDWVAGGQIEGTVARFNERLRRTRITNENDTNQDLQNGVPVGAPTTFQSQISESNDNTLTANWMVTALARVGHLVTPNDMIYGLGGWTYASFQSSVETEDINRTFNMNGPTVGLGWERQLAYSWTIRGEYRYTRFLDRTLTTSTPTTQTSVDAAAV